MNSCECNECRTISGPSKLYDYKLLKKLGAGGFSKVYLSRHRKNDNLYAIKIINRIDKKNRDITKTILREIEIMNNIKHTNIVRLYEYFISDKKIYLVMEYVNGKDLTKYFDRELPPERIARVLIRQIVHAIKYCHDNKIIHRDIKCQNILIDKDLQIKLTDFGLSTYRRNTNRKLYGVVGTIRFSCPELLERKGYDEKADIWSLGIVIYYLLTGKYPFNTRKIDELLKNIYEDNILYDDYVLKPIQIDLLRKILNKDPSKRLSLIEILNHPYLKDNIN